MSDDFLLEDFDLEAEDWEELDTGEKSAFIAMVIRQNENLEEAEASLDELERLADTAGIAILGRYSQRRSQPERSSYFGKGFLEELSAKLLAAQADILIVNEELSPMQARNIEKNYSIQVMDRTELILSIFHQHAKSKEAKLQVRLAELEYQLPRLRRLWEHFDKERGSARSGGGSATRGMGEKQIEIDRRLIRNQIRKINQAIDAITRHKETQRKQRDRTQKICLVGYTNAGKSTLFNQLTDAGVLVEDKLFATLDSTSRQLKLSTGKPVVISDTVGFISNLPHHLIASFRATLMEAVDADLLLHVVDAADPRHEHHIQQVNEVLHSIGAQDIPVLLVLNKSDLLSGNMIRILERYYPEAIAISAQNAENIPPLLEKIEAMVMQNQSVQAILPYSETGLVSRLHEIAKIESEDYREDGIHLQLILPQNQLYLLEPYRVEKENH